MTDYDEEQKLPYRFTNSWTKTYGSSDPSLDVEQFLNIKHDPEWVDKVRHVFNCIPISDVIQMLTILVDSVPTGSEIGVCKNFNFNFNI
jgi:hypothetical protein